ncbi:hypothetical protein BJ944DRAFT_2851 [Cunninghamella echinulata]|nr:hypothetical protein BJ944DRAFT_2851 [Cunninghamella echinulata]
MVAKQMAKALTNTCHKQSMKTTSTLTSNTANNDKSSSTINTAHSDACSKPQLNPAMNVATPPTSPTTLIHPSSSSTNNNNNNILTNNSTPPTTTATTTTTTTTTATSVLNTDNKPTTSVEPMTEIKDGVEWVSFVYSHHRVVRRYRIRTDLGSVDITKLDEKFKSDNCVYPRANLPREAYQGNRWAYETECNMLGWKLAHLNMEEIAGKRGLIQRAVDSYRNRYPSMRSRRVARQEKLLKGTLRKRKQSPIAEDEQQQHHDPHCKLNLSLSSPSSTLSTISSAPYNSNNDNNNNNINNNNSNATLLSSSIHTSTTSIKTPCTKIPKLYPNQEKCKHPKTLTIEDRGVKCRVRINIDTVDLTLIDDHFKKNNCVFPRAINISSTNINITQRRKDEARCNEIGWKLAWLNPKHLANKKNLLQRILDIYRTKFVPDLTPRQSPSRYSKTMTMALESKPTPLTTEALAAHHQQQEELAAKNGHINHNVSYICKKKENNQNKDNEEDDDNDTIYTGTTDSLDFRDCFSPPPETITSLDDLPMPSSSSLLLPPSSSSASPSSSSPSLITPLLNTTHSIATTTATATNDMIDFIHPLILPPPPPMKSDEYFDSLLDPLASPPPQSLSATLTTSDLMDDSSCHLSVDSSCQNSPPHRYNTSLGSFSSDDHHLFTTDPLLVLQEDHHHRQHNHSTSVTITKENDDDVYMFDAKPSSFLPPLLPTDIFLTTDMDWSNDVKDCMLVDVQQPDVLMNQLFST